MDQIEKKKAKSKSVSEEFQEGELLFAEKKKPVVERIVIDGKVYLDITEAFLATDWEVVEVGV